MAKIRRRKRSRFKLVAGFPGVTACIVVVAVALGVGFALDGWKGLGFAAILVVVAGGLLLAEN